MRHLWVVIPLLAFLVGLSDGVEVSGYFEPQFGVGVANGEFYQVNTDKLRIDLKSELSDEVSFGANFDYVIYRGKTKWNILDYLPRRLTEAILEEMRTAFQFSYEDRDFLDNAYLKLSFRRFDLTVGKQQISLGTGYAWNPTDVYNVKDLMDPTYEQPGHNAVRLDIPISTSYGVVLIYTPESRWSDSGKLMRLKGKASHFDYSLILIERVWKSTDYMRFATVEEKRRVFGGDFAGELLGIGVWGEFAYNRAEEGENFWEGVLGFDYTLDVGTYLMCELYHNSSGKSDHNEYNLNDWMRFLLGEARTISRDQIYLLGNHPLTDLMGIGCSAIVSLSDGSVALVPMLSYDVFEDVELTAFGNLYLGEEGKMFSSRLGNGLLIRARVYF
jgi:hypothetical protein